MSILDRELKKLLSFYERQCDFYSKELMKAPDGCLYHQYSHGKNQFLVSTIENGVRERRCITNDEEVLRALAKKEFAVKAIRILSKNIKLLKKAVDGLMPFDPDMILQSMNKAYALLPEAYFFDGNVTAPLLIFDESDMKKISRNRDWGNQPYKESQYHAERKTIRTSRGTYVRSKSELAIIESLYDHGIPMHYDEEHIINGKLLVPDFTFKDRFNELFFWEYMGMMDDTYYAKRNLNKLDDYCKAGIIPGDNLIVTFDKSDNINMGIIEAIIHNEIIPRL